MAKNRLELYGYLPCRDLRHSWEYVSEERKNGLFHRMLRCSRCGTERIDQWRFNGDRHSQRYRYPGDYKLTGAPVKPAQVRQAVIANAQRVKGVAMKAAG